jgi:hypothetical protein
MERDAHSLLGELAGTLVLGVPQQLDDTALIGGETGDLLDDVADKGGAAGETALGAADAGLGLNRGGFLYHQSVSSLFNITSADLIVVSVWSLVVAVGVQFQSAFVIGRRIVRVLSRASKSFRFIGILDSISSMSQDA